MPRRQPSMLWQQLRNLTEKFSWQDRRTGVRVTGYNPPTDCDKKTVRRVPFFVRYVTLDGRVEQGEATCIKVFNNLLSVKQRGVHQRLIRFEASGEIRRICDCLIIEVDGIRIVMG